MFGDFTKTRNFETKQSPMGGIELGAYAQKYGLSPDSVWDLIESGELRCHTEGQAILILDSQIGISAELPPLPPLPPPTVPLPQRAGAAAAESSLNSTRELALFIDHLSLAKEENKEVLRLSHEAIQQISSLAEQVKTLKDELIAARDREISRLEAELIREKQATLKLHQENEDLEMLLTSVTATAASHPKHP